MTRSAASRMPTCKIWVDTFSLARTVIDGTRGHGGSVYNTARIRRWQNVASSTTTRSGWNVLRSAAGQHGSPDLHPAPGLPALRTFARDSVAANRRAPACLLLDTGRDSPRAADRQRFRRTLHAGNHQPLRAQHPRARSGVRSLLPPAVQGDPDRSRYLPAETGPLHAPPAGDRRPECRPRGVSVHESRYLPRQKRDAVAHYAHGAATDERLRPEQRIC